MSFTATQKAFANGTAEHGSRLVLLALAHRHNSTTGQCNPSLATLATDTLLARSTVIECLAELERLDLIRRVVVPGHSTSYELSLHKPGPTRPISGPVQKSSKTRPDSGPKHKEHGGAASADAARPQRFSRNPFA